jgi:hypothetical protein
VASRAKTRKAPCWRPQDDVPNRTGGDERVAGTAHTHATQVGDYTYACDTSSFSSVQLRHLSRDTGCTRVLCSPLSLTSALSIYVSQRTQLELVLAKTHRQVTASVAEVSTPFVIKPGTNFVFCVSVLCPIGFRNEDAQQDALPALLALVAQLAGAQCRRLAVPARLCPADRQTNGHSRSAGVCQCTMCRAAVEGAAPGNK